VGIFYIFLPNEIIAIEYTEEGTDGASLVENGSVLENDQDIWKGARIAGSEQMCTTPAAEPGEIRSYPLTDTLGYISRTEEPYEVGLELKPREGSQFARFMCGGTEIELRGAIIAPITPISTPVGPEGHFTVVFQENEGKQEVTKFEGGPTAMLEGQVNKGGFQPAALQGTDEMTPEAPVEIRTGPHYYINSTKGAEGERVPYIAWGTLALTNSLGGTPVSCENAVGGWVENPVGGGPGKEETTGWTAYNCKDEECELAGGKIGVVFEDESAPQSNPVRLEWPGEIEGTLPAIRLASTNVKVYVRCQFVGLPSEEEPGMGPFEGLEKRTSVEYNAPGAVSCTTKAGEGSSKPRLGNGTGASNPSTIKFSGGAGGELICSGAGKGIITGSLKIEGYNLEETITTQNE
jgi:hypothetical protein